MLLPSHAVAVVDGPALAGMALRGFILLALAGAITLTMRKASAAARHWLWLLAMAGLLALPLLIAILPGWNILPSFNHPQPPAPPAIQESRPAAPPISAPTAIASESTPLAAPPALPAITPADPLHAPAPVAAAQTPLPHTSTAVDAPAPASPPAPVAAKISRDAASIPWPTLLIAAWLLGVSILLLQLLLGHLSLALLARHCKPLDQGELSDQLAQLRTSLGIRRRIQLLTSTRRTMPMTWGLWTSRLLLPDDAAGWSPQQRRSVLLHELAHVRRFDCVAQLIAQLACALHWFNPLVWVAWHRMQVERERACDDLVLNNGERASTYAEHLLGSASHPSLRWVASAVAMARPSTLEERLRAILDPTRNRRALTFATAASPAVLLTALLMPVAALQAQQQPAATPAWPTAAPLLPIAAPAAPAATPTDPTAPAVPETRPAGRGRGGFGAAGGFGASGRGGGLPGGASGGNRGEARPHVEGPTCSLDATIYDVRLPADKIGQLDLAALNNASSSAASFEKALGELGTFQPLYRANQSVQLAGDSITIGTSTPYVTNSQITSRGQTINSVSYSQTGANFTIAGKSISADNLALDLRIEISAMSEGNTQINDNVKAPVMRRATLLHKGPATPGKPFVVVSVDAASPDPTGKAVACIARITLGPVQPAASPPPQPAP